MKHIGMIYENDIPDVSEMDYANVHGKNLLKMIRRERNDHRWKPNGITDNIEEWRRKHIEYLIEKEYEDPFILNP